MSTVTRVRYTKRDDGILISKEMATPTGVVFVMIDPSTLSFKIKTSVPSGEASTDVSYGAASSLAMVKKMVKNNLIKLGVPMLNEIRTKQHKVEEGA